MAKFTAPNNEKSIARQVKAIRTADTLAEIQGKPKTGKARSNGFVKGQSGNPAGRAAGGENKLSIQQARKAAADYDILPLDFFLSILNNPEESKGLRVDCAKAAAPYVHRKMPIGIDNGQGGPITFATPEQLAKLSTADLKKLEEVMQKLAAITTPGLMVQAATAAAVQEQTKDDEDE